MLKLSENPPILPPSVRTVSDLQGRWWVAHTKPRAEKVFAFRMLSRDIGYFLPLIERIRVWGGKKRHVLTPLFPSYVFFCGTDQDRYQAMTTNRVCQIIEVHDQALLASQLASIEKVINGKAVLDPYPFAAVGRRCRVTAGPFQGLEGVVVQRDKACRLVLEVSILGQGAAMEIDADLLEPAE
jgi:transcriptional antiterminator RfaH